MGNTKIIKIKLGSGECLTQTVAGKVVESVRGDHKYVVLNSDNNMLRHRAITWGYSTGYKASWVVGVVENIAVQLCAKPVVIDDVVGASPEPVPL
jgi:hypothetical protein